MKETTTTETLIFPDSWTPEQCHRYIQAVHANRQKERDREEWFQKEVERRGLDRRGIISGILGF